MIAEEHPSVPHRPLQFNTSVPHKDHTIAAPKIPQFNTKNSSVQHIPQFQTNNPSVQHQKSLSSTPKTPQFNTKTPSVQLRKPFGFTHFLVWNWVVCWTELLLVWNWGVFRVALRGFWCGNYGILGLKMSSPFVWNWCVELRGAHRRVIHTKISQEKHPNHFFKSSLLLWNFLSKAVIL